MAQCSRSSLFTSMVGMILFHCLHTPTTDAFAVSQRSWSSSSLQQQTSETIEHSCIEIVDLMALSSSSSTAASSSKLPVSWTQNWSTWIFEATSPPLGSSSFVKIPDTNGFVSPSSVDTLFQPVDLKAPTISLAIGLHM
jgi:hypothetical protein